jgi:2-polyprenyl-3-methyl-5-hydroxy-6-metoxy-1,4-benzoquinol methylase
MTFTETIRLAELEVVLSELKSEKAHGLSVLEIGAGAGWQARELAANNYCVKAIDLPGSLYSDQMVWPVIMYDGSRIPFPDNHFDIIFSSNTLEHVINLREFQAEMKRVLKPRGIAIHVVPSATWRFWTCVAHYPFILKIVARLALDKMKRKSEAKDEIEQLARVKMKQLPATEVFQKAIFPAPHGARGTALSEIYFFSRSAWRAGFLRAQWKVESVQPNALFYTGYLLLGAAISISTRRWLSQVLGSACHIFKLRKMEH